MDNDRGISYRDLNSPEYLEACKKAAGVIGNGPFVIPMPEPSAKPELPPSMWKRLYWRIGFRIKHFLNTSDFK